MSTSTNLELRDGHFKRPPTNLPRGFHDLEQQWHVRGVERATGIWAHGHSQFPLHVHQLEKIIRFTANTWKQDTKYENRRENFFLTVDIPGQYWVRPAPPAGRGLKHRVHSTICAAPGGKLWTICCCLLPAVTPVHPQRCSSSHLTWTHEPLPSHLTTPVSNSRPAGRIRPTSSYVGRENLHACLNVSVCSLMANNENHNSSSHLYQNVAILS